jgi:hypothetical protein
MLEHGFSEMEENPIIKDNLYLYKVNNILIIWIKFDREVGKVIPNIFDLRDIVYF